MFFRGPEIDGSRIGTKNNLENFCNKLVSISIYPIFLDPEID